MYRSRFGTAGSGSGCDSTGEGTWHVTAALGFCERLETKTGFYAGG